MRGASGCAGACRFYSEVFDLADPADFSSFVIDDPSGNRIQLSQAEP